MSGWWWSSGRDGKAQDFSHGETAARLRRDLLSPNGVGVDLIDSFPFALRRPQLGAAVSKGRIEVFQHPACWRTARSPHCSLAACLNHRFPSSKRGTMTGADIRSSFLAFFRERGHEVVMYDPYVDSGLAPPRYPRSTFLIGTKHPEFVDFKFPEGSVVIDPWRYIPQRRGIKVVSVGARE